MSTSINVSWNSTVVSRNSAAPSGNTFNAPSPNGVLKKAPSFTKKYKPQLQEVTKKYGVPERILIAFWGMETNYGGYTGNTPIIESLATLSYDKRRSKFFKKELLAALKIIEGNNIPVSQMKGSWAGAMGQCQFMPSNYLKYSVDADASGKRDLWNSLPDVFHSMGNFLEILGWQKGENWGREVELPSKTLTFPKPTAKPCAHCLNGKRWA